MKKINLKSIKSEELLSREELKRIMGGFTGSGSGRDCSKAGEKPCYCKNGEYHGCRETWECGLVCSI